MVVLLHAIMLHIYFINLIFFKNSLRYIFELSSSPCVCQYTVFTTAFSEHFFWHEMSKFLLYAQLKTHYYIASKYCYYLHKFFLSVGDCRFLYFGKSILFNRPNMFKNTKYWIWATTNLVNIFTLNSEEMFSW